MKKYKNIFQRVFSSAIAPFLLGTVYFLGIGFVVLLAVIFDRRLLFDQKGSGGSTWRDADGYDFDRDNITRES